MEEDLVPKYGRSSFTFFLFIKIVENTKKISKISPYFFKDPARKNLIGLTPPSYHFHFVENETKSKFMNSEKLGTC